MSNLKKIDNDSYIQLEKFTYSKKQELVIDVLNCGEKDWVGIYAKNNEPGMSKAIVWKYVNKKEKINFDISSLKEGEYSCYLCQQDGYDVLFKVDFYITEDESDYQITKANLKINKKTYSNQVTIKIYPSSKKNLTYFVYWCKDKKRLEDYTEIKQIHIGNVDCFDIVLNECIFMPNEANGIEIFVLEGHSSSYFLSLDDTLKIQKSKYCYSFQILTDLHIENFKERPQHVSHLKAALKQVSQLCKNSQAIISIGDHTNHGYIENYECLFTILKEAYQNYSLPKIYYALGNHEYIYSQNFSEQISLFKKYTSAPNNYYSFNICNHLFIILGSDSIIGEGTIHKTQLDWLKEELAHTHKDQFTFLFVHQPLMDTVSGSLYSKDEKIQYWYGIDTGEQIKDILKEYPNAILFTGHTHWTLDAFQPLLFGSGKNAHFVNCSSVGYLWNDNDQSESGSEGMFIEVYEDYLLIRGREFVDQKWCSAAQFIFPLIK